jgi:hypothetical protein
LKIEKAVLSGRPFYRLDVETSEANGLDSPSQVMVDDDAALIALNRMLSTVLGLADQPIGFDRHCLGDGP